MDYSPSIQNLLFQYTYYKNKYQYQPSINYVPSNTSYHKNIVYRKPIIKASIKNKMNNHLHLIHNPPIVGFKRDYHTAFNSETFEDTRYGCHISSDYFQKGGIGHCVKL